MSAARLLINLSNKHYKLWKCQLGLSGTRATCRHNPVTMHEGGLRLLKSQRYLMNMIRRVKPSSTDNNWIGKSKSSEKENCKQRENSSLKMREEKNYFMKVCKLVKSMSFSNNHQKMQKIISIIIMIVAEFSITILNSKEMTGKTIFIFKADLHI